MRCRKLQLKVVAMFDKSLLTESCYGACLAVLSASHCCGAVSSRHPCRIWCTCSTDIEAKKASATVSAAGSAQYCSKVECLQSMLSLEGAKQPSPCLRQQLRGHVASIVGVFHFERTEGTSYLAAFPARATSSEISLRLFGLVRRFELDLDCQRSRDRIHLACSLGAPSRIRKLSMPIL